MSESPRPEREWHLWSHEWRGAKRRWWLRPWLIPMAILWVAVLFASTDGGLMDWTGESIGFGLPLQIPEEKVLWVLVLPQAILILWMVWVIIDSFVRDRLLGVSEQLALTLESPRRIVLSKTFAATAIALLSCTILGTIQALLFQNAFSPYHHATLPRYLGHTELIPYFRQSPFSSWRPPVTLDLPHGPFRAELCLRIWLWPFVAVTLAAWVGSRAQRVLPGAVRTVTLFLLAMLTVRALDLLFTVTLGHIGRTWIDERRLHYFTSFQQAEAERRIRQAIESLVYLEIAWDLLVYIGLPVIWFLWWWRWTKTGFQRAYLHQD